jgi:hypothetical protein
MHETLLTPLPVSWLASRLKTDAAEIARLREAGQLFGEWSERDGEWLYPAWQFGPGGKVPQGVREAVAAARRAGLSQDGLIALLRRRVGLVGGARFSDLLFEGRADTVVAAIRGAATMATNPTGRGCT